MKTFVIYHKADYDGIFCREIAKRALPDATFIGWDYGDPTPEIPKAAVLYMLDVSVEELMTYPGLIWIDHHASAIAKYPASIAGYRIDGVAACRLAYQWFNNEFGPNNPYCHPVDYNLPQKQDFLDRKVNEPFAVMLAGEYDIWDHRGDGDLEFQFGLDSQKEIQWYLLLDAYPGNTKTAYCDSIINAGRHSMQCYAKRDADVMRERSFVIEWEGLRFLALNTPKCNSNTFSSLDVPKTGHDALMAFYFNGKAWNFSLYHSAHNKGIDLSLIASKHGGGGHKGACGFRLKTLPF